MATVIITTGSPGGNTPSWTLTKSTGELVACTFGNATVRNLDVGSYTLAWAPISGYSDPPDEPITLASAGDEVTAVTPAYNPASTTGTITINGTDTASASPAAWTLVPDPGGGNDAGTGDASFAAPTGQYTITWGDNIADYDPPGGQGPLNLTESATIVFDDPTYVVETGTIEVFPTPDGTWTLTGPEYPGGYAGSGDETLAGIQIGTYSIVFDDSFLEYTAPTVGDETIAKGETKTFIGNYTSRGSFDVTVQVSDPGGTPDGFGAWTITNDEGISLSSGAQFGASGSKDTNGTPVAPSSGDFYSGRNYTLTFSPETGYSLTTTNPQAISAAGTFTGTYIVQPTSTVTITPTYSDGGNGEDATWTLYGPGGYELEGSGTQSVDVTAVGDGDYWLRWGWMLDYWPPVAYDADQVVKAAAVGVTLAPPQVVNGTWGDPAHRYVEVQAAQAPLTEPWSQGPTTMTGGSGVSFTGQYQARTFDRANAVMGTAMEPQKYYTDAFYTSNRFAHRSFDHGWGVGQAGELITWPDVTSNVQIQLHAPGQSLMPQGGEIKTFRVFWKGSGTLTIGGVGSVTLNNTGNDATWNAPGVTFDARVYPLQLDANGVPEEFSTTETRYYMTVSHAAAAPNHLREIQVVAEDYVAPEGVDPSTMDASIPSLEPLHWKTDLTGNYLSEYGKNLAQFTGVFRFLDHLMRINRNDVIERADQSSDNTIATAVDAKGGSLYKVDTIGPGRGPDDPGWQVGHTCRDAVQQYIDICNGGEADMWLCIPWQGGDPSLYWPHPLMEMIIDQVEKPYTGKIGGGLNPALKVIVEWGNEMWLNFDGQSQMQDFWASWYANSTVDQFGNSFPMGQRGSKHPGFDDQYPGTTTSDRKQYISFRTWKVYEQVKDKLETRGGVDPWTGTPWTAKVPGTFPTVLDRWEFVSMHQAGPEDPKGTMPFWRERVDIGGGTMRPTYTGAPLSFDAVTDFWDIVSYQGAAFYDNGPSWRSILFNGHDVDGFGLSEWEQEWRDYCKRWADEDPLTEMRSGNADGSYKSKQAPKRFYQDIRDNLTPNVPKIAGYEGTTLGHGFSSWDHYMFMFRHPLYYGASFSTYWRNNIDAEMDLPIHFIGPRSHELDPFTGPWGLRHGDLDPDHKSRRWQAYVDFSYLRLGAP